MLPPIIDVETWKKEYIVFCYAKKTAISTLDQGVHRGIYSGDIPFIGLYHTKASSFGEEFLNGEANSLFNIFYLPEKN